MHLFQTPKLPVFHKDKVYTLYDIASSQVVFAKREIYFIMWFLGI